MKTEVLLSLLRGLSTSSQGLVRDEMEAESVGVIGSDRLWDRDGSGVGSEDCSGGGGARRCGATVIFVDCGVQPGGLERV